MGCLEPAQLAHRLVEIGIGHRGLTRVVLGIPAVELPAQLVDPFGYSLGIDRCPADAHDPPFESPVPLDDPIRRET
jgi:hypothetical protein